MSKLRASNNWKWTAPNAFHTEQKRSATLLQRLARKNTLKTLTKNVVPAPFLPGILLEEWGRESTVIVEVLGSCLENRSSLPIKVPKGDPARSPSPLESLLVISFDQTQNPNAQRKYTDWTKEVGVGVSNGVMKWPGGRWTVVSTCGLRFGAEKC